MDEQPKGSPHPVVEFIRRHNDQIPAQNMHEKGIHVGRLFTEKGKEYARVNVPHALSVEFRRLLKEHGVKEARHSPDNADKVHGNRTGTGLRNHTTIYLKQPEILEAFRVLHSPKTQSRE